MGGGPGGCRGKSFHVDNDYRWWDLWGGVSAQINTSTVAGERSPIRPEPRSRPRPFSSGWVAGPRDGRSRSNPQLRGGRQDLSHLHLTPDKVPKGLRIKQRIPPPHPAAAKPPRVRSQTLVGAGGRGLSGHGEGAAWAKRSTLRIVLGNTMLRSELYWMC